jgi:hypothetical protein
VRRSLLPLLLTLSLAACVPTGEGEWRLLPVGGGEAPPAQQAQPSKPIAPGADRMLQDPEGDTWDEVIDFYARSEEAARAQCEDVAANRSRNGAVVTCLGCKKMTAGDRRSARYSCTLRVEAARSSQ